MYWIDLPVSTYPDNPSRSRQVAAAQSCPTCGNEVPLVGVCAFCWKRLVLMRNPALGGSIVELTIAFFGPLILIRGGVLRRHRSPGDLHRLADYSRRPATPFNRCLRNVEYLTAGGSNSTYYIQSTAAEMPTRT